MTGLHTSNTGGKDFKPCKAGMHVARCFKVVDLGTHVIAAFGGKEAHQVRIYFELPKQLMAEGDLAGQPFILSKAYTLSHHEKAILRIDLQNWAGKKFDTKQLDSRGGFNLQKVLGRPAMLGVVHSEDGKYANIASVNPLPEGMICPLAVYEPLFFSLEEFDQAVFNKLGTKLQNHIKTSAEYIAMTTPVIVDPEHGNGHKTVDGMDPEDIPF